MKLNVQYVRVDRPGVDNADAFVALCYAFRGKRVNLTKGLDVRVFQQTG